MVRPLNDNRGVALILTISIVTLLVALTMQFNGAMRSEIHAAMNLRDGVRLSAMARSGFNYGLAVLFEDGLSDRTFDSLLEPWADAVALSQSASTLSDQGTIEMQIRDESARIQINQLVDRVGGYNEKQKEIVTRLLSLGPFGLEAEEVGNILDAIKDWIDPDDEPTKFGAESAYYRSLERPYACRNAPLESLDELLLVRGVTKTLFYGTSETPGISRYLTVHGEGKVNINTADPLVLRALSANLDEKMVEAMLVYREDREMDLSQPGWYKGVPGMSSEVVMDDLITTSSRHFEIRADGVLGTLRKGVRGLVERKEGTIEIISWKVQ